MKTTVPRRAAAVILRAATDRRLRAVSQVLLLVAIVFVVLRLRSTWRDSHVAFSHLRWGQLAGAVLVTAAGMVAMAVAWVLVLRRLGADTRRWFVGIFFQSQLSKYIPGSVWQYAGRTTLAAAYGVSLRLTAWSLGIELAAQLVAAGAAAVLLAGWPGIAALGAVGAGTLALPTFVRVRRREAAAFARAAALYCAIWAAIGVGFWLTASALFGVGVADLPVYAGAFAAAWAVGLLAVYAPGGLGVREAMLVVLLRGRLGTADALVLAAVSRAIFTALDLIAGLAGSALLRVAPPRPRPDGLGG